MLHIAFIKDHATYSFVNDHATYNYIKDHATYNFIKDHVTYVCAHYGMVTLILTLPDKSHFFSFLSYLDLGSGR